MDTLLTFINGSYHVKKEETNYEQDVNLPMDHITCANSNTETTSSNNNTDPERKKTASEENFAIQNFINDFGIQTQIQGDLSVKANSDIQLFDDDVFNEFLNPNCFQQPNDIAEIDNSNIIQQQEEHQQQKHQHQHQQQQQQQQQQQLFEHNDQMINTDTSRNAQFLNQANVAATLQDDIKRYEDAKEQLMAVKFGLKPNSKYVHHSETDFCYTKQPVTSTSDDHDVTYTTLPKEYAEAFYKSDSDFPYKLKLEDLPSHSRVETQIKLELSVSPAPFQYLLHIPRDAVTKPRFTLSDNSLPDSLKQHLLFLDVFVIGSEPSNSEEKRLNSYNVCKRCMRRELKRASRRKSGLVDDLSNWDLNLPKRAIILNTKQIVSFPPPNSDLSERKLELLSRIVCYCRHHQEPEGFRIAMFLKDHEGNIIGKVCSTPILIMDRKKSVKSADNIKGDAKVNVSSSEINLSSSTAATSSNAKPNHDNHVADEIFGKTSLSVSNLNVMNILNKSSSGNDSKKPNRSMFSSIFSFDPASILDDENARQIKRPKRQWSQSQEPANGNIQNTYYESVAQRRMPSTSSTNLFEKVAKKEQLTPSSSDAISPQAQMMSSAASVFSSTPERRVQDQMTSITTPPYNTDGSMDVDQINMNPLHNGKSMLTINNLGSAQSQISHQQIRPQIDENAPSIKRIIPAQGPIRGGIEITLLGSNFKQGLNVKFGSNIALATQCWSESTIVTYLPPASQAGPVLVTFEDPNNNDIINSNTHQIFTYTDDTDRQLIELALQIVGLKMNGKLEDAKNIAKRIVGNNQIDSSNVTAQNSPEQVTSQQLQLNWMAVASNKIKELSNSSLNHEEILIKFLNMIKIPNSLISHPNWAVCNLEGQTMLHLACFYRYNKLAKYLIQNGCRVHFKDNNGFTPLHYAFISGNREMINYLITSKANASNKLDNGLLLSEISDPNVLDLINNVRERRLSDASFEQEEEDNDFDVSNVRCVSHTSRHVSAPMFAENDCNSEADDEGDDDSSLDSLFQNEGFIEKEISSETTNSFGVNLWIAMRDAIRNKLSESKILRDVEGNDDNEPLPSYDDLFPNGGSLRALMNFRSYTNEESDFQDTSGKVRADLKGPMLQDDIDEDLDKDGEVDRFAMTVGKSLDSDKKLLFFWLPCMLLLLLFIIGNNLNVMTFQEIHYFSFVLDKIREYVGSFMLGKERFTNLINENINYGRERMENLLNDVNGVVMTAVVGAAR